MKLNYSILEFCLIFQRVMEGDGSPLSSLCVVRAAELFPKPEQETEDDNLKVPFTECKFFDKNKFVWSLDVYQILSIFSIFRSNFEFPQFFR